MNHFFPIGDKNSTRFLIVALHMFFEFFFSIFYDVVLLPNGVTSCFIRNKIMEIRCISS